MGDAMMMKRTAKFSECKRYRYRLGRYWEPSKPYVIFCLLNPSTADAYKDDPTIRRCINYAIRWQYGGLEILNIFAYRATNPKDMKSAPIDPIGIGNRSAFSDASKHVRQHYIDLYKKNEYCFDNVPVICGWGTHGGYKDQGEKALEWIHVDGCSAFALDTTKDGFPKHPLYLKADLLPSVYEGRKRQ